MTMMTTIPDNRAAWEVEIEESRAKLRKYGIHPAGRPIRERFGTLMVAGLENGWYCDEEES